MESKAHLLTASELDSRYEVEQLIGWAEELEGEVSRMPQEGDRTWR